MREQAAATAAWRLERDRWCHKHVDPHLIKSIAVKTFELLKTDQDYVVLLASKDGTEGFAATRIARKPPWES